MYEIAVLSRIIAFIATAITPASQNILCKSKSNQSNKSL